MKKVIVVMLFCGLLLSGCSKPEAVVVSSTDGATTVEVTDVTETEENCFSEFSATELAWIESWLVEKKLGNSLDDVKEIACLGGCKIPTANGEVIREDLRTYAVTFVSGVCVMVNIPVEELEE